MRRTITALVLVASIVPAATASAHPTRDFEACTRYLPEGCIRRGAAFLYGDTVIIRGRVSPPHDGLEARVLRQDPRSERWRVVDVVRVTARGKMRFHWDTTRGDAVQDAPYRFRFRIPGHGASNATEAFVLLGE
jgi:hypothetical protein